MDMVTQVKKWGNSRGIRIPKPVAEQAGIDFGSPIRFSARDGEIVITRVENDFPTLDELLAGIPPENLHGEISTGAPVGNEVW